MSMLRLRSERATPVNVLSVNVSPSPKPAVYNSAKRIERKCKIASLSTFPRSRHRPPRQNTNHTHQPTNSISTPPSRQPANKMQKPHPQPIPRTRPPRRANTPTHRATHTASQPASADRSPLAPPNPQATWPSAGFISQAWLLAHRTMRYVLGWL